MNGEGGLGDRGCAVSSIFFFSLSLFCENCTRDGRIEFSYQGKNWHDLTSHQIYWVVPAFC